MCHIWGRANGGGFPPPESKLCPICGSARSEPKGLSGLLSGPNTHLLGSPVSRPPLIRICGTFGAPLGEGVIPLIPCPIMCCSWKWLSVIPPLYMLRNQGSTPVGAGGPDTTAPHMKFVACRHFPSDYQLNSKVDIPSQPSSWSSYTGQASQRSLSGRQIPLQSLQPCRSKEAISGVEIQ